MVHFSPYSRALLDALRFDIMERTFSVFWGKQIKWLEWQRCFDSVGSHILVGTAVLACTNDQQLTTMNYIMQLSVPSVSSPLVEDVRRPRKIIGQAIVRSTFSMSIATQPSVSKKMRAMYRACWDIIDWSEDRSIGQIVPSYSYK